MAKRGDVGPSGLELRVEVHWCPECGADCTVQIVQLGSDPQPVAMCAECGAGLALWLDPALVDPTVVDAAFADVTPAALPLPRTRRLGAA